MHRSRTGHFSIWKGNWNYAFGQKCSALMKNWSKSGWITDELQVNDPPEACFNDWYRLQTCWGELDIGETTLCRRWSQYIWKWGYCTLIMVSTCTCIWCEAVAQAQCSCHQQSNSSAHKTWLFNSSTISIFTTSISPVRFFYLHSTQFLANIACSDPKGFSNPSRWLSRSFYHSSYASASSGLSVPSVLMTNNVRKYPRIKNHLLRCSSHLLTLPKLLLRVQCLGLLWQVTWM